MKVCILSMQKVPNFGSLLQSYSLKKCIEELGHTVSFIDIEERAEDNVLLNGYCQNFSNEREVSKGLLAKVKKIDRYVLNRIKIKKLNSLQYKQFNAFCQDVLKANTLDRYEKYDVCIIGSDEVFNCLSQTRWGFTTQLFGDVKQAKKVITYAASCGATTYEKLPSVVAERISQTFKKVSAFSVRDYNTEQFVQKLTDKDVHTHLDPVIIGDFNEEILEVKLPPNMPSKYCIVYSYYNRMYYKDEIRAIKKFCKEKNLTIVSIGAPQMWIKNHMVLNPFQVLLAFKMADFVITDTFHGTIFSAKYAKRFAVLVRPSNKNKLLDLVERVSLDKHLMSSINQLETVYNVEKKQNMIDSIQFKERKRTVEYLRGQIFDENTSVRPHEECC